MASCLDSSTRQASRLLARTLGHMILSAVGMTRVSEVWFMKPNELYTANQMPRKGLFLCAEIIGGRSVSWQAQRPYKPPEESGAGPMGSKPPPSASLLVLGFAWQPAWQRRVSRHLSWLLLAQQPARKSTIRHQGSGIGAADLCRLPGVRASVLWFYLS